MNVKEVTLICESCAMPPISAQYTEDQNPQVVGILANVAAVHIEAYPEHTLRYVTETIAEAAERHAAERDTSAEEQRRMASEIQEQRERRETRALTEQRPRTTTPTALYLPRRRP